MTPDPDVQRYLDAAPAPRRRVLTALHSLILSRFPNATVTLKFRMPTYSYRQGWVAIANQKHYVSLYTCAAQHLEAFKHSHPQYRTGKACINFREKDEIPTAAIRTVIEHAILHPKIGASG